MKINYENPEVVARQNIAPNAGCDIDGVFYDMRNCIHMLKEQADRIEELEAKLAKAMEAMEFWSQTQEPDVDAAIDLMQTTLAELKGEDRG
jgi:hypothetical protein